MHAFSVCDDPDYFYDYVQDLLDGLQAGVRSHDIVDIQNVGITSLAEISFKNIYYFVISIFKIFIFLLCYSDHSTYHYHFVILFCETCLCFFSTCIVNALVLLHLTFSSSCLKQVLQFYSCAK